MRWRGALLLVALLLSGCDYFGHRPDSAMDFPEANRPVAPTVATRWDDEDVRDRLGEADDVMDQSDIRAGMTVADIGAGDGYYTVRLASRTV